MEDLPQFATCSRTVEDMRTIDLTERQYHALLDALGWIEASGTSELTETISAAELRSLEQAHERIRRAPMVKEPNDAKWCVFRSGEPNGARVLTAKQVRKMMLAAAPRVSALAREMKRRSVPSAETMTRRLR